MVHTWKTLLFLSMLFFHPSFLQADEKSLDELILQENRPSLEASRKIYQFVPNDLTIYSGLSSHGQEGNMNRFLWQMMYDAPRFIATVEKAFPGAMFAFVGRDVFHMADMMESFYESLGQKDRVVRLGVSKGSFTDRSSRPPENQEEFFKFLTEHGFSWEEIIERERPFVLVDTVSSGGGRQGRGILDVIYNNWVHKQNGESWDILRKVNMVGFTVSTFGGDVAPVERHLELLTEDAERYRSNSIRTDFYSNHRILHYQGRSSHFGEAGYDHFVNSWHGSYGPLYTDRNTGRTYAAKGEQNPFEHKMNMLTYQKAIVEQVESPAFLDRVLFWANELGYEFPTKRSTALKVVEPPVANKEYLEFSKTLDKNSLLIYGVNKKWESEIANYFNSLDIENAENSGEISKNGESLIRFVRRFLENCNACNPKILISKISASLDEKKLTKFDVASALLSILELSNINRQTFEAIFYDPILKTLVTQKMLEEAGFNSQRGLERLMKLEGYFNYISHDQKKFSCMRLFR